MWVREGVLYAANLTRGGLAPERLLYDFNPLRFERLEAPY